MRWYEILIPDQVGRRQVAADNPAANMVLEEQMVHTVVVERSVRVILDLLPVWNCGRWSSAEGFAPPSALSGLVQLAVCWTSRLGQSGGLELWFAMGTLPVQPGPGCGVGVARAAPAAVASSSSQVRSSLFMGGG
eukprot:SAG31_NODE_3838_length_3832_cov_3.197696_2_plen_135_part_00